MANESAALSELEQAVVEALPQAVNDLRKMLSEPSITNQYIALRVAFTLRCPMDDVLQIIENLPQEKRTLSGLADYSGNQERESETREWAPKNAKKRGGRRTKLGKNISDAPDGSPKSQPKTKEKPYEPRPRPVEWIRMRLPIQEKLKYSEAGWYARAASEVPVMLRNVANVAYVAGVSPGTFYAFLEGNKAFITAQGIIFQN